jgi:hypothetical protein
MSMVCVWVVAGYSSSLLWRFGFCPADYFGRTMVANLPQEIKVEVIKRVGLGNAMPTCLGLFYQAMLLSFPEGFGTL